MEYKVLLLTAVFFVFTKNVHALKCYSCSSHYPDETCFEPIDTNSVPSKECDKNNRDITSRLNSNLDQSLLRAIDTATEFECVFYEKIGLISVDETSRGCFPKITEMESCRILGLTGSIYNYNLTSCRTCALDNCNGNKPKPNESGTNGDGAAASIQISVLCVLLPFLVIKYYLNK